MHTGRIGVCVWGTHKGKLRQDRRKVALEELGKQGSKF